MPPALDAPILDLQAACSAARAHPRTSAQTDRHDHPLPAERHILHQGPRELEHPVECHGDTHVVLLAHRRLLEQPAACRRGRRRVTQRVRNLREIPATRKAQQHGPNAAFRPSLHPQTERRAGKAGPGRATDEAGTRQSTTVGWGRGGRSKPCCWHWTSLARRPRSRVTSTGASQMSLAR
jgi:hypothetical protein